MHTVLVLGGYGFFGARISAHLAREPGLRVLIGGRDAGRAAQCAQTLGLPSLNALQVDAADSRLADVLAGARVDTLVHTAGPFQGQDYAVAEAAIAAGSNYIDLADARNFVSGITTLDSAARGRGVRVVSGASSVPALSSAVVDRYRPAFGRLDAIRIGIGSGVRTPGLATMSAVFGYCGKPLLRMEHGRWVETHGWLDAIRHRFPEPVGPRWLGSCDVPDLQIFPERYAPVQTVTFHAGFGSGMGHLAVWLGAQLVKRGLIRSLAAFAPLLHRLSRWMEPFGTDKSAMFVELHGTDHHGQPLTKAWSLVAQRHHGPEIPCGASIALTRKLAGGAPPPPGAYPCVGLLSVDEYLAPLATLDIHEMPPRG